MDFKNKQTLWGDMAASRNLPSGSSPSSPILNCADVNSDKITSTNETNLPKCDPNFDYQPSVHDYNKIMDPSNYSLPAPITSEDKDDIDAGTQSLFQKILRTQLIESKNEIEILQRDPNSPLYSVKSFEQLNLPPPLLKGIYSMGYNRPSKIQESALPILFSSPPINLIAQSQSGTGKTAAFVLAMINRVNPSNNYPQVLCLSPTFDLAIQTGKVFEEMGRFCTDIHLIYALKNFKRFPNGHQINEHVIIGTPGTILDWIKRKFFNPSCIQMFVLDEADVMISLQGHQEQTIRIYKSLSNDCQQVLFSATYDDSVMKFSSNIVQNPTIIRLKREQESLDSIRQYYVVCDGLNEKLSALGNIYGFISVGQAIVFCQTKKTAHSLASSMVKDGHSVSILSGDLDTSQRVDILTRFREGKEKVLITTNVCSRGLDIDQVTLVINFDIPVDLHGNPDFETYLHRIGRTGRFGKKGIAINFVDGAHDLGKINAIQTRFGKPIDKIDKDDTEHFENIAF